MDMVILMGGIKGIQTTEEDELEAEVRVVDSPNPIIGFITRCVANQAMELSSASNDLIKAFKDQVK